MQRRRHHLTAETMKYCVMVDVLRRTSVVTVDKIVAMAAMNRTVPLNHQLLDQFKQQKLHWYAPS